MYYLVFFVRTAYGRSSSQSFRCRNVTTPHQFRSNECENWLQHTQACLSARGVICLLHVHTQVRTPEYCWLNSINRGRATCILRVLFLSLSFCARFLPKLLFRSRFPNQRASNIAQATTMVFKACLGAAVFALSVTTTTAAEQISGYYSWCVSKCCGPVQACTRS